MIIVAKTGQYLFSHLNVPEWIKKTKLSILNAIKGKLKKQVCFMSFKLKKQVCFYFFNSKKQTCFLSLKNHYMPCYLRDTQ